MNCASMILRMRGKINLVTTLNAGPLCFKLLLYDSLDNLPWLTIVVGMQIDHYLQVVKTEVVSSKTSRGERLLEQYDYTAHSSMMQTAAVPVAKFHFELSPMQVGNVCHRNRFHKQ
jgi:hypothetical protein